MPIEKIYYKIREHLILKLPKKTIAKKLNPVLLAFNKAVFNENKKNIAEFYPRLLIENCYGFSKEKTHLISLLSLYINEENYSILCQHLMKKIEVSIKNLIKTERLNESLVASRLNENWCGVSNEPLWEAMSYDINDMGVDKNLLEGAKNLACFSENVRNGFSENVMGGILEERYLNGKSVDENNPFR